MKAFMWLVVVTALGGLGFFVFNNTNLLGNHPAPVKVSDTQPVPTSLGAYSAGDFAWQISNVPDFDETNPRQNVSLAVKGKVYPVGTYTGCATQNIGPLESNEIVRLTCWFGGGGNTVSVFNENGAYSVKEKWIQESGGDEASTTPEGPLKVLFTLE